MNDSPTTQPPKLAAILAIDVVGFSRLMREDEARTLAALKRVRTDVVDVMAATYNGRLFKAMGDGFLLEFASVTNAVQCAIEIQRKMVGRNATRTGAPKLEFRMGLNVGDIIPDQDDVFGDGVNVAARLEALAEPSGICISGAVYEQIRHTVGDRFTRMGPKALKNIDSPIEVYALSPVRRTPPSILRKLGVMRTVPQAVALLVVVAAAGAVFAFSANIGGDRVRAVTTESDSAADVGAAQAARQSEAERISADAEAEAAKAKAEAAVAAAKAEAEATTAEAEAKAQALKRAVDAWREASIAVTEAAEQVGAAETSLAELKARLAAAEETAPADGSGKERRRTLAALAARVGDAEERLKITQARHDAAVKAETDAKAHMDELKAVTQSSTD